MIRAGSLDRRIVIRRSTATVDELNNPVLTWADYLEVNAAIRPATVREQIAARETGAAITTTFTIRYSQAAKTVNPKDRLTYDGKDYDILGINELGRREGFDLTAIARAD